MLKPGKYKQVIKLIYPHSQLLRTWELGGGVSAQTVAVEFALLDNTIQRVVFCHYGILDLEQNAEIAVNEFKLIQQLRDIGLPVPLPLLADTSNQIFPTPYLVTEFVDGDTIFSSADANKFAQQLAHILARIHWVNIARYDLSFLPNLADVVAISLNRYTPKEVNPMRDRIYSILSNNRYRPQYNESALLHGDYWLGNLLWNAGQLVAIVDWEDVMLGDPLADLGKSRLEMLWALGENAMQVYTQQYLDLMPPLDLTYLYYWDLWGAYRLSSYANWFDDSVKVNQMQMQYHQFVDVAIRELHAM